MKYSIILIKNEFIKGDIDILGKPLVHCVIDELNKISDDIAYYINDEDESVKNIVDKKARITNTINLNPESLNIVLYDNVFVSRGLIEELVTAHKLSNNKITSIDGLIFCIDNDIINSIDLYNINQYEAFSSVNELVCIKNYYDLSVIQDRIRKEINIKHMKNGVIIENPNTVSIGLDVIIHPGAIIKQNTCIYGDTVISKNAIIGPNTSIISSYIDEASTVLFSIITNSKIGKNTNVGPFSHIRMNTVIGDNDRIGNFVEIKNSSIDNNTCASHLTYIGDTECGSSVNFGCGTVTVNFDGHNKHKTVIGDNVFIGCNSNLVAPLSVASNTFIAAGSTIVDSLEEYDFAIARSKQITKPDYAKKFIKKQEKK